MGARRTPDHWLQWGSVSDRFPSARSARAFPAERASFPPAPPRTLAVELLVVLSLSFLPSAVDSLISLLSAPLAGTTVALYPNLALVQQLVDIVFALAPVGLVLYLIRRNAEEPHEFGLRSVRPGADAALGVGLAAVVAGVGLGVYVTALALRINRFVVPVPPLGHWWTVPVLVLGAGQAGLLEEIVVNAYTIRRLGQIGASAPLAITASALLRASYHLYQGWGGFAGNLALGVFFGTLFARWRRTWPLVVAHATVNVLAGVGYIVFRGQCVLGACIR